MDNTLNILKAENGSIEQMINNPKSLIRKMGLVPVSTPLTADLTVDPFRGDVGLDDTIHKSRNDFCLYLMSKSTACHGKIFMKWL